MTQQNTNPFNGWELFQRLEEADIQRILTTTNQRIFRSGESLCRQGDSGESMFLILSGRVRMSLQRGDGGEEQLLNILHRGNHFGELALLSGSPRTASATALMDTLVLEIPKDTFFTLLKTIPEFSINISRTIGNWLRTELSGKTHRNKLKIIAIVHANPITGILSQRLINAIARNHRKILVFSDRTEQWIAQHSVHLYPLPNEQETVNPVKLQQLFAQTADGECLFVDVHAAHVNPILLMQCERIWWLAEQDKPPHTSALQPIKGLLHQQPALGGRLQMVWVQASLGSLAPPPPQLIGISQSVVRCQYDPVTYQLRDADLARFQHLMQGIQLGLALGGGGAKGLAHLGVLAAFQENGLYFDQIAGTSVGAIIAAGYASGLDLPHLLDLFNREMTPPWWMRYLPKGSTWHLMGLFRFHLVEKRFRRYLHDYVFEQLLLPTHMVSVDLISGKAVIRSSGDLVNSVLESINHPMLGVPIFRDGKALVDGGVLINVPTSVLRQQKMDYIVSIDVGSQLSPDFGGNARTNLKTTTAGYFSTLNRVLEVSYQSLSTLHMTDSDFLIKPNTSSCAFEDFTAGSRLFEIGYEAAMNVMPDLKQNYATLLGQV